MANYPNSEGTGAVSISVGANSASRRDQIFLTKAKIKVTMTWRAPEDQKDNSFTPSDTSEDNYVHHTGNWYTYKNIRVEVSDIVNGTQRSYWLLSSGDRSNSQTWESHTINNLNQGAANTLAQHIVLTYDVVYHSWETINHSYEKLVGYTPEGTDEQGNPTGGEPIYETWYSYSVKTTEYDFGDKKYEATSNTITVYTRPNSFSFGCQSGQTIETTAAGGLTAARVSEWAVHAGKYRSWYLQSDQYNSVTGGASKGALITATWYNSCVDKITAGGCSGNPTPSKVSGGLNGTIISAAIINALGTAVSKGD